VLHEKNGLLQFQMESCQPIKRLKDKKKHGVYRRDVGAYVFLCVGSVYLLFIGYTSEQSTTPYKLWCFVFSFNVTNSTTTPGVSHLRLHQKSPFSLLDYFLA
jgi:hypothetical protein